MQNSYFLVDFIIGFGGEMVLSQKKGEKLFEKLCAFFKSHEGKKSPSAEPETKACIFPKCRSQVPSLVRKGHLPCCPPSSPWVPSEGGM